MAIPKITPLPPAPSRQDAPADFTSKADAFVAAQVKLVTETNASIDGINGTTTQLEQDITQAKSDIAGSVSAASSSATTATNAATAAKNSQDAAKASEQSAQTYASAAGAAGGFPPLTNGGDLLMVKEDKSGVRWAPPSGLGGIELGDVIFSSRNPGSLFLPTDGSVYSQSQYPALFALLGLVTDWSQFDTITGGTPVNGAAGNGNFVIAGSSAAGAILRSTDGGLTYTSVQTVTSGTPSSSINSVSYGNGLFLVTFPASTSSATTTPRKSTDNGSTWTPVTGNSNFSTVIASKTLNDSHYDGGQFIVCDTTGGIYTTPDLVTWTARTSGVTTSLTAIGTFNNVRIAVGVSGVILTSSDNGVTWVSRTSGVSASFTDVAASSSVAVAVSASGVIVYSYDGITWNKSPYTGTTSIPAVTWTGEMFVISTTQGVMFSRDGKAWSVLNPFIYPAATNALVQRIGAGRLLVGSYIAYPRYDTTTSFAVPNASAPFGTKAWIRAK